MKKETPQADMLTRILIGSAVGLTILACTFATYFLISR